MLMNAHYDDTILVVGVFVELEPVGVAKFTYMGTHGGTYIHKGSPCNLKKISTSV